MDTLPPIPSRTRRRVRLLLPFAIVILALVAIQLAQSRLGANRPISSIPAIATPTPGPAPQVALPQLDGPEAVTLDAWKGRGVILNFWASWCGPCRAEMPALADTYNQQPDQVVVVGVNHQESADTARDFVTEYAIPFPILLDRRNELGEAFGIQGLPTTYFINRDGQIIGMHLGPLTPQVLDAWVARLTN